MKAIFEFIRMGFEDYKLARRLLLIWACWLITYTMMQFFANFAEVRGYQVTVITAVIGILTVVIGFYQWHRNQDND